MPKTTISRKARRPLRGPLFDAISSNDGLPRYQTIYRALRASILGGTLKAGTRLPSTRTFAADLRVSRKTAEEAYAQLEREGFVERRTGSGTYVADVPAPVRLVQIPGRSLSMPVHTTEKVSPQSRERARIGTKPPPRPIWASR